MSEARLPLDAIIAPVNDTDTPNQNSKMSAIAAVGLPALRAPVRVARRSAVSKVRLARCPH